MLHSLQLVRRKASIKQSDETTIYRNSKKTLIGTSDRRT